MSPELSYLWIARTSYTKPRERTGKRKGKEEKRIGKGNWNRNWNWNWNWNFGIDRKLKQSLLENSPYTPS